MKRAAVIALLLAGLGAFALASGGFTHSGDEGRQFTVELDNAFGIVKGGDLKIAGVSAGQVTRMRVDRRSKRALVDFRIDKTGFSSLRRDVYCESRPQSLIGEYYIDCLPGKAKEELPEGSIIPVRQTSSTVPPDLVQNVMRRPQRERLRIILNEIGAGVGARAEDINETIRRAHPALRETNRVLATLARQNRILADLVENGDEVIGDLTENKEDVSRWIRETRETAAASAERSADISGSVRRLPEFLRELRPTMTELGRVADAQRPSLADLNASAGELERFFGNLGPFARSSRLNLRSLGAAARQGRPAVKAALPLARQLETFSRDTPELANNTAIVLRHLEDRNFAIEKDPRSPGGQGYTGIEAFLQYVFDQAMAINVFDANGYMLKVNLFESECSEYQNADSLKAHLAEDPEFEKRCGARLGPNQPGIFTPDISRPADAGPGGRERRESATRRGGNGGDRAPAQSRQDEARQPAGGKPPISLGETLAELLDGRLPQIEPPRVPRAPAQAPQQALLDFLLGS